MARIAVLACLLLALVPAAASAAGRAATARALAAQMRQAGGSSGALAVDLDTGARIYGLRAGTPRMPASVEKLYTSATALRRMGASTRLQTEVLAAENPDAEGVIDGNLYLRGNGDPTFNSSAMKRLAGELDDAGIATVTGRVVGDESAFDLRRGVPSSGYALTSEVGPLSALTYNRGLTGMRSPFWQPNPAKFAAKAFTRALRRRGIGLARSAQAGTAPADAEPMGLWRSHSLGVLLRDMNQPSDNFMAETLAKVLGARYGDGGTTAEGAAVMRAEMGELGVGPSMVDGSGLSRSDRTSPQDVVTLLKTMDEEIAFTGSLAIAGRNGTLEDRMRGTAAQDRCQAKTGTLSDVSALAGYCTTLNGRSVAFAILMNAVYPYGARQLQDRMVNALVRYSG
jgi:D-alanyl-D-alanine carboxypeptidase/D-alanyl-D-alanine-endopeptidase (penicillin-binding protein 4)